MENSVNAPTLVEAGDPTIHTNTTGVPVEMTNSVTLVKDTQNPQRPTAQDVIALSATIDDHLNNYMIQYETNLQNVAAVNLVRLFHAFAFNDLGDEQLVEIFETIKKSRSGKVPEHMKQPKGVPGQPPRMA